MITTETYNGWKNWETWNANLWLTNDEYTNRRLESFAGRNELKEFSIYAASLINALGNPDEINLTKVDWREIYESFKN